MSLAPVFLGALARRKLTTALSLFAIVMGVALGVAVQAIHEAALAELDRGAASLSGTADWQVRGAGSGFDDALWAELATHPAIAAAAPVIELEARLVPERPLQPNEASETLPLLGIDLFAQAAIAPQLLPRPAADRLDGLAGDAIFLSRAAREKVGRPLAAVGAPRSGGVASASGMRDVDLRSAAAASASTVTSPQAGPLLHAPASPGGTVRLLAGTRIVELRIAGDLPGIEEDRVLAVMDIAAVQQQFGWLGRLSRIDLKLVPNADVETIRALLPPGLALEKPQAASDQMARLTRAYRVNLGMLASIALLTGLFLVFSAQALAVVRRQTEFAFLRAIGLDRAMLLRWLVAEGGVVGLLGGALGVAVGHALAWGALRLLGGDLGAGYFSGIAPALHVSPGWSLFYLFLGMLSGIVGAWLPARQAARIAPAQALKAAAADPLPAGRGLPWLGLALMAAAAVAAALPPWQDVPIGGYLAVLLLLAGGVLCLPALVRTGVRLLDRQRKPSPPWRLATARLADAPGHATVAAAGVLCSVALAVAMAIMVSGFRSSVDEWLTQVLPADLYLRASAARSAGLLDIPTQQRIREVPGVRQVDFTRHEKIRLAPEQAPVALLARPTRAEEVPVVGRIASTTGPMIWISEALADQRGWRPGDIVDLPLAGQPQRFAVAGVWRDYARQTGAILLDLDTFRALTGDAGVHDAAIHLAPGAQADTVRAALLALAPPGVFEVASAGEIRRISLAIFDRTFLITYLIEAVAIGIGLAGVAASFAALAAARRREFGMLRHLGVSRAQIGAMLALEGSLVAGGGVLAGLAAGGGIGWILIEVINRQSFHWSMDWAVPWGPLALFAGAMIGLAALAAVAAGRAAMQQQAVLAVREDW